MNEKQILGKGLDGVEEEESGGLEVNTDAQLALSVGVLCGPDARE